MRYLLVATLAGLLWAAPLPAPAVADDEDVASCVAAFDDHDLAEAACQGEVKPDMTPEMVREAWGDPQSIRTGIVYGYVHAEEWTYGSLVDRKMVYFVDRRVHDVLKMDED